MHASIRTSRTTHWRQLIEGTLMVADDDDDDYYDDDGDGATDGDGGTLTTTTMTMMMIISGAARYSSISCPQRVVLNELSSIIRHAKHISSYTVVGNHETIDTSYKVIGTDYNKHMTIVYHQRNDTERETNIVRTHK